MAEGRIDADDETNARADKLAGIKCNMTLADIDAVLHKSSDDDQTELNESMGKVEAAIQAAKA